MTKVYYARDMRFGITCTLVISSSTSTWYVLGAPDLEPILCQKMDFVISLEGRVNSAV